VDDQAKVIRKANAYAELIITNSCRYKMPEQPKGKWLNYVKAYLSSMTNTEVTALKNDTKQALEDLEDTNRSMAVYRDGDDLLERVHTSCFTVGQQRLLPKDAYKPMDEKTRLHARLTGVPEVVLHPGRILLRKVVGKTRLLPSDQPIKGTKFNPPSHSSIASSSAAIPAINRAASTDGEESRNLRRSHGEG
jgi:hypothetical protein